MKLIWLLVVIFIVTYEVFYVKADLVCDCKSSVGACKRICSALVADKGEVIVEAVPMGGPSKLNNDSPSPIIEEVIIEKTSPVDEVSPLIDPVPADVDIL